MNEMDDWAFLQAIVPAALTIDGAHHKQWFLERIAEHFELDVPDHEPGIAP